MLYDLVKRLAPAASLAAGALAVSASGGNISMGETNGVPLAELDRSGAAPTELVLAGPDGVMVVEGGALDIAVSGDPRAVEALRFSLEDGSLAISREKDAGRNIGRAQVRVTTPSLAAIVLAGSGTIDAQRLSDKPEVTIAGSGKARVREIAAESFDLTIAGSGEFEGSGTVDKLDLTIAGSGSGRMANFRADRADVSIVGSGSAEFASDGTVEGSVMGSGTVTVHGNARCDISKMGSGNVTCRGGNGRAAEGETAGDASDGAPSSN